MVEKQRPFNGTQRLARLRHWMPVRASRAAVDWLLPPRCGLCETMVAGEAGLCPACFSGMTFLSDPLCQACGKPLEPLDEQRCGGCQARPPAYDMLRAAFAYDDPSRALVLALKYNDRLDLVPALSRWMALAGGKAAEQADYIMPVPLHWRRYLARRFNQSAALAQGLASVTGSTYAPDWVERTRNTPQMKGLSQAERRANVQGAFKIQPGKLAELKGKRVVLVDDVYTSGATVSELCEVLRAASVAHIAVIVVARVVGHTHMQLTQD